MSLVLDLPSELETELSVEAARLGLPVSEYALQLIAEAQSRRSPVSTAPSTGAALLNYWQQEGLVGTRPEIESSQLHARLLREQASKRLRP